ncbi:hypothetical protein ACVW1A_002905 [Bradyrhizobium sp. LB1.3]
MKRKTHSNGAQAGQLADDVTQSNVINLDERRPRKCALQIAQPAPNIVEIIRLQCTDAKMEVARRFRLYPVK